jgi:molybdopterin-binding protein
MNAPDGAAIEVQDLTFSYPGTPEEYRPFLQVPLLRFRAGSISVLIGDNGSGKTTLMKLIAGLLTPTSGEIRGDTLDGTIGRGVLLVHQRPYLFAESVLANVVWPLRIRRMSRGTARDRGMRALEQVGLAHLAHRWALSLSGGEKQRVAIARALVLEPRAILLDEPTAGVDKGSVTAIEGVLHELAGRSVTIVLSTHNLPSAYRLADHLVPIGNGRIQPMRVNILRGVTEDSPHEHLTIFRTDNGLPLVCPASSEAKGTAVIPMDDVIISLEALQSSAQNGFAGTVVGVDDAGNDQRIVTVETEGPPQKIRSILTERAVRELAVAPGKKVWLTFKASAVELY